MDSAASREKALEQIRNLPVRSIVIASEINGAMESRVSVHVLCLLLSLTENLEKKRNEKERNPPQELPITSSLLSFPSFVSNVGFLLVYTESLGVWPRHVCARSHTTYVFT